MKRSRLFALLAFLLFAFVVGLFDGDGALAQIVRPAATPRGAISGFAVVGNCTDSNVALWLDFENASGNLTVPSGCAASGTVLTVTGTPTYSAASPLGRSITLDGSTTYFSNATDVASLEFGSSNVVIEGWLKPALGGGATQYIVHRPPNGNAKWDVVLLNGNPALEVYDNNGASCVARDLGVDLRDDVWHRFRATWVFSTGACTITVDSRTTVSALSGATSVAVSADLGIYIGTDGASPGTSGLNGRIADLRITIGNATNNLTGTNPVREIVP